MYFYMPTRIYCEKNCVRNHAKELSALGNKALIVTGKRSAKENGSLADVQGALTAEGIPFVLFDHIEENPSIETVMEARDFGNMSGADFVIGIGGGSPLDAAKAISLMMKHRAKTESFLYEKGSDDAYPVVSVPTTCGTGSEATPYAILTIHKKRTKSSISHRIFPALALCDPTYLKNLPLAVLASTSIDALGHFMESYINNNATLYSKMLCIEGMKLWASVKDLLLGKEGSDTDYEALLNASTLAGMAISHTGTSLPHGLSYYPTYETGVPHGKAVGIFLPAYLNAAENDQKEILSLLNFRDTEEFASYIQQVLGTVAISDELKRAAVEGMLSNQAKLANCPFPVDENVMQGMFLSKCISSE